MDLSLNKSAARLGIISDTHGLLRPEVASFFAGVDYIIHAGDIGKPSILANLEDIAPVIAVLGNTDIASWYSPTVEQTMQIAILGKHLLVLHDLHHIDTDLKANGITIVIHGHTHKPSKHTKEGILYLNPGSAGPQRAHLPISIALLTITEDNYTVEHKTLSP